MAAAAGRCLTSGRLQHCLQRLRGGARDAPPCRQLFGSVAIIVSCLVASRLSRCRVALHRRLLFDPVFRSFPSVYPVSRGFSTRWSVCLNSWTLFRINNPPWPLPFATPQQAGVCLINAAEATAWRPSAHCNCFRFFVCAADATRVGRHRCAS